MQNNLQPVKVMLVEDSEPDIELLKFTIKKNKFHVDLEVFNTGDEALESLFCEDRGKEKSLPNLIILDINLPGISGIDVLKEVKGRESTKYIPVIMLTSSIHDEDILQSYSHFANCFIQKPLDFESFQKITKSFEEFWLTIVKLPNND